MDLASILKQPGASIVDVREPYEFEIGHISGAQNIPLHSILDRLDDFRQMTKPIVLYCHTGSRSRQARMLLEMQGIGEVYNDGGMEDVEYALAKQARVEDQ